MYLRTTARRTKGGEVVRYLALAHNERNERGMPIAKVIHNLGREDMLDREALQVRVQIKTPSAWWAGLQPLRERVEGVRRLMAVMATSP